MTAAPTFTRRRGAPRTGYGQIPNGLWTLDVPMGARVLLGWLHSHTDDFLAGLTVNKCRRALGTSQIVAWLEALEGKGLVAIDRSAGAGSAWVFDLDPDAWLALSDRADIGSPPPAATEPTSAHHRADIGAPVSAREEEQVKNTTPEELPPTADAVARELVDAYWLWVKDRSGHPPAGIAYIALVNVVRPFVEAGWELGQIKRALAGMYEAGRSLSRQSLEAKLRGQGARPALRPAVDDDRSGGSGPVEV